MFLRNPCRDRCIFLRLKTGLFIKVSAESWGLPSCRDTVQFELDVPDIFKTESTTSKVQNGNSSTYLLSGFLSLKLKSVPLLAPPLAKNGGALALPVWRRRLCSLVILPTLPDVSRPPETSVHVTISIYGRQNSLTLIQSRDITYFGLTGRQFDFRL